MRTPAEILSLLIASGISPQQIALVAEYGLASVAAVTMPAPETSEERRRRVSRATSARYRERHQTSPGDTTEVEDDRVTKRHQTSPGDRDASPPRVRGLDNPLTVEIAEAAVAEARDAGEPSPPASDDWPSGDATEHAAMLVQLAASPWLDPQKSPTLVISAGRLVAWRRLGASWKHDVVPVIQGIALRQRDRIRSWTYFDDAIAKSIADNLRALELPPAANLNQARIHDRPDHNGKFDARQDQWAREQRGAALAVAAARGHPVGS